MIMNDMAVDIWEMATKWGYYLSAAHIPGKHNILADVASREFQDAAEWMIPTRIFNEITDAWGMPDIDLFASRLNHRLDTYASWKPDPSSSYIDAMMISWSNRFIYAFPPFSMLWPVIAKFERDCVEEGIIFIPRWPTQSWYPTIMKMMISKPIEIPSSCLVLPGTDRRHPLKKMKLLAVHVN